MSLISKQKASIIFEGGSYETNIAGQVVSFPSIQLYAVLITVTQAKKIIRTEIQGKDGTVKEYIGMDDYQIEIVGTITAAADSTPDTDVIDLKKMLDAPVPIGVVCTWLQNLGITDVVIESYNIPQDAGGQSYQTFTINCTSHIPTELRIRNA